MAERETNTVAERFIRTLKQPAIYGRTSHTAADMRAAVQAFIERSDQAWLVERNGFRSPAQARATWTATATQAAA